MSPRGGKRPGAGRPRTRAEGDEWTKLTITLTTGQLERIKWLAEQSPLGSVSAYVRRKLHLDSPGEGD